MLVKALKILLGEPLNPLVIFIHKEGFELLFTVETLRNFLAH